MSTYLYLECTEHDPPILSRNEGGQHLRDLLNMFKEIRTRQPRVKDMTFEDFAELSLDRLFQMYPPEHSLDGYFSWNIAEFMLEHPHCKLTIRDEYGEEHVEE